MIITRKQAVAGARTEYSKHFQTERNNRAMMRIIKVET